MRALILSALLICWLGFAGQVFGQVRPGGVELGAYAGAWEGDAVYESGATFGLRGRYDVNSIFGAEATAGAVPTSSIPREQAQVELAEDTLLILSGINGVLHLSYRDIRPYLTAGLGVIADEDPYFAMNAAMGLSYDLDEMLGLRAEFRTWLSDGAPSTDRFHHFEANLGVTVKFGGTKDIDSDGIDNRSDLCPTQAEDRDKYQDDDGCPDEDNDGDGVKDAEDKCPDEPAESKEKPGDGCPAPVDADEDGVLNDADKCVAEAEDKDGFQDEDGCPDPDNDGDGILDAKDRCPDKAETVNGFEDEDGCPDEKPAPVEPATPAEGEPAEGAEEPAEGAAVPEEKAEETPASTEETGDAPAPPPEE